MTQGVLFGGEPASSARISPCGRYRTWLMRALGAGPTAAWVMLNPSTADADRDDPTILRCVAFSKRWGCGRLEVVNLFAWRATDPNDLWAAQDRGEDVVGPENDGEIVATVRRAGIVIAAWGADPFAADRARRVTRLIAGVGAQLHHLGLNADRSPKHPLARGRHRIPDDQRPVLFGL